MALAFNGCYSSSEGLSFSAYWGYQSSGWCQTHCPTSAVIALEGGYNCYCGDELPPLNTQVEDSKCDVSCSGYGADDCGGDNYFGVYTTGNPDVPRAGGSSSSSSSSSSSASPSPSTTSTSTSSTQSALHTTTQQSVLTVVNPGTTVIQTVGPTTTAVASPSSSSHSTTGDSSSNSGHTSVGGIVAGVVIGVVALIAIIVGLLFYLRRRRRHQMEDSYTRQTQVSEFMRSGPPGSSYSQMSDSRLEPQFNGRRNSAGSIADNQDYSRRILRVANPDSS